MKTIELTKGKVALVDDADFDELNKFSWYASQQRNGWYARRNLCSYGKSTEIYMQNQIMGCKGIDHINRNGLDNQRHNLREATASLQIHNSYKFNMTGYRGVYRSRNGKWEARIKLNRTKYLGTFKTKEEAALAFNAAAFKQYGDAAVLNQITSFNS